MEFPSKGKLLSKIVAAAGKAGKKKGGRKK